MNDLLQFLKDNFTTILGTILGFLGGMTFENVRNKVVIKNCSNISYVGRDSNGENRKSKK